MTVTVLEGDCIASMATLPAASVQCCVTSPPYYGLRDYGMAGQIGLEPTPDAYVARMVDVFREVRRVLRDDGTLWLNVGDSYAATSKGTGGASEKQSTNAGARFAARKFGMGGAKSKDLMGIPWQLAFALRQPYYAGRIKRELDRVWLAAMIDAEGCMFIHRRKAGAGSGSFTKADGTVSSYVRINDTFSAGMEVANTSLAVVERCQQITGLGSICSQSPDQNNRRKQTIYRWNLRTNECRDVVREVYPHFVAKAQQARILIGAPASGERAAAAHAAMIDLHNGKPTDVDFPEPASMFEPGWYLRSDIIWAKKNCMPESVRDRPTSAHEHVFLLTKQARYFYDAAAIADDSVYPGDDRHARTDTRKAVDALCFDAGSRARTGNPTGDTRNARNVWTIATQPYSGAHFATMPPDLAERCIKAGTKPGDHVLDPFGGAGTTGLVADRLGRSATLCELNPAYAALARNRIRDDAPLFGSVA